MHSMNRIDDIMDAIKLTLPMCNNAIHIEHEENALQKYFEIDVELKDVVN